PKFTPSTGAPPSRKRARPRSIVPSPPSTTATSGLPPSPSKSSSTPERSATVRMRSSATLTSLRLCTTTAARSTDGIVDPAVELSRELRSDVGFEVEEEFTVSLGPRQARVYDPGHARPPPARRRSDLAQDTP